MLRLTDAERSSERVARYVSTSRGDHSRSTGTQCYTRNVVLVAQAMILDKRLLRVLERIADALCAQGGLRHGRVLNAIQIAPCDLAALVLGRAT